ncbi:hypothetical protein [Nonomuraea helvata]|uniref:Uncharacterized protein n=1 Tax=Nonomuraea helvata TaxID=37484 RepID=A0ABV5SBS8_9ACTN
MSNASRLERSRLAASEALVPGDAAGIELMSTGHNEISNIGLTVRPRTPLEGAANVELDL